MHRIVLASTSPYRRALLTKLGVKFQVEKPRLDEELAKTLLEKQNSSPLQIAISLARQKAESLKDGNSVIIGGDQLVNLNGEILGKPHTEEKAVAQLLKMQNKTHEIITAVCVVTPTQTQEFYDITKLTMKALTQKQLQDYVERDQPLDCAGSYKIEKTGMDLFSKIVTKDFSAIEGLPLIQLRLLLQTLGYDTKEIN